MNAIMPRNTVEQIVSYRNKALELFEVAHAKIEEAHQAELAAIEMAKRAVPATNAYNAAHDVATRRSLSPITKTPFEDYMRERRHIIDLNVWAWVVSHTELEHLMDKQAKDQLREQMSHIIDEPTEPGQLITEEEAARGMPPVTVENIVATVEQFMLDADKIFRRGIANAFAKLDRRFRSHDGFKVGSRIILSNCFDDYGHWHYQRDERSTLIDIERTFTILDGRLDDIRKQDEELECARRERRPVSYFTKTIGAIDLARQGQQGARQSEVETDYFKVRIFKNGNAHLWFTRKDLVERVNKLLAEHYGEVIGNGQPEEDDPLNNVKSTPARYFGFFPTPEKAAEKVLADASFHVDDSEPPLRVLEPSAGTGNLAKLCVHDEPVSQDSWGRPLTTRRRTIVDCIELQPHLADQLKAQGIYNRVTCADFLQVQPDPSRLYDRIVMNPPFDRERDIDHVMHAMKFLKEDGILIAIMSAGTEFRQTKKAVAFRKLMEDLGASWRDLPPDSFAEVGTHVNTGYIKVAKNGKPKGRYEFPTWPKVG